MKKLLIVSPHFCPVNAPDMQRARLALPHLRALGWETTVLALAPETIERPVLDPLLEQTYPADIRVVRARGLPPGLARALGFGGLWLRAGRALRRAGDALLARERFDLVFFTTTQFDFLRLGPRWLVRHGVPCVLDYQDPWVNDYYARTGAPPPGGRLRYALARRRALRDEPRALRTAAGVVAVSPAYVGDLARRYPWFDPARAAVLPFGASAGDFEVARARVPPRPLVPFGDGNVHLVSTGRAGADLAPALRLLFAAFARFRKNHPAAAARFRFHFIGTSYAPPTLARDSVAPLAREAGLDDQVNEHRARVPYFEALHYLSRADCILAVGSDDPAYTASKLAPCLLAARPVLSLFHHLGPAQPLARAALGANAFAFGAQAPASDAALVASLAAWFGTDPRTRPAPDAASLRDHTAEDSTRRLAEFFARVVTPTGFPA